jgi:hypothetical protein
MRRSLFAGLILLAACGGGSPLEIIPADATPPEPRPSRPAPTPPSTLPPPPSPTPGDPLAGGVLATFKTVGPNSETFSVWVTNAATIDDLLEIQAGIGTARHPNGKILRGAGRGDHNAPYSWHLDPEDTQMVDVSAEVCDGRPSVVDANLDAFLAIERYCPWAAALDSLEDHR